jgi:hypothetical protein
MKKLDLKFVDSLPQPLEDGVLYVSIRFRIVSHNCCCGCGNEVVVNLSPKGWQLTYDGESISLFPSIGEPTLKCRSHYWIRNNEAQWARRFPVMPSGKAIGGNTQTAPAPANSLAEPGQPQSKPKQGAWQWLKKRFF